MLDGEATIHKASKLTMKLTRVLWISVCEAGQPAHREEEGIYPAGAQRRGGNIIQPVHREEEGMVAG